MTAIWKINKELMTLDAINERGKGNMVEWLGIEFTEIGDNYLEARMPVDHRTKQPIGIMHGGSSCVLAESTGSTAANLAVDLNTHYCVGLTIDTSHIRSIKEGWVIARAHPVHIGKSTHVWHITIKNEHDQLISDTRLTMAVLKRN